MDHTVVQEFKWCRRLRCRSWKWWRSAIGWTYINKQRLQRADSSSKEPYNQGQGWRAARSHSNHRRCTYALLICVWNFHEIQFTATHDNFAVVCDRIATKMLTVVKSCHWWRLYSDDANNDVIWALFNITSDCKVLVRRILCVSYPITLYILTVPPQNKLCVFAAPAVGPNSIQLYIVGLFRFLCICQASTVCNGSHYHYCCCCCRRRRV